MIYYLFICKEKIRREKGTSNLLYRNFSGGNRRCYGSMGCRLRCRKSINGSWFHHNRSRPWGHGSFPHLPRHGCRFPASFYTLFRFPEAPPSPRSATARVCALSALLFPSFLLCFVPSAQDYLGLTLKIRSFVVFQARRRTRSLWD